MRRAAVAVLILGLAVALAGCGRVGAVQQDEGSPTAPTLSQARGSADTLDAISSLLDSAGGAVDQSSDDLSAGEEAEAQE